MLKMIECSVMGKLDDGREVKKYRVTNSFGEYAEFVDLGAVVHSLCVMDRNGKIGDCVLGCPDVQSMVGRNFKGATIGRCANRIEYGRCVIDGKAYQLEQNRGGHFLHGGSGNYANRFFAGSAEDDGQTVTFYLHDTGEGGFGNEADAWVHFTFDDSHSLTIRYEMSPCGEATVLCPTNHAYFNLGDLSDARDHVLTIYASNLAKSGESGVPTGGLDPVAGRAVDFTSPRTIREAMESDPGYFPEGRDGYDDFYVLDRNREDKLAAVLCSPKTGRVMKTYTDMQSVILFTPSNCRGRENKYGELTEDYSAVCIETQFVPNAVNVPEFDSPVFRPGEKLESTTVYSFSVIE